MRKLVIYFSYFLFVFTFLAGCKDSTKTKHQITNVKIDSIIKRYLDLQNQLVPNRRFDEAMKMADSIELFAKKYDSKKMHFQYLKAKGFVFNNSGKFDSAMYYYNKARTIIPALDSQAKYNNNLNISIGSVLKNQERWSESFAVYKTAYDYKKQNRSNDLAIVAYQLGIIARAMGSKELSKKYLLEAIRYKAKPMVKTAIATAIQQNYMDSENLDSAKYYFNKYIVPDTTLTNPLWLADREETKGRFLSKEGHIDAALKQYLKTVAMQSSELGMGLGQSYLNVAEIYLQKGQYAQSLLYADSAIISNEQKWRSTVTGSMNIKPKALRLKAIALQKMNNSKEAANNAIMAYDAYMIYADSLYSVKVKSLELLYDTKAKNQRITNLANENKAAKKINQQQKIIVAITIALLLFLIIFGISYYRRIKLKNKVKQIEIEQRLLRSQMEPHFLYNTLGVLQSFIRTGQTEKAIKYLGSFAKLLRSNLENSRHTYVLLEDEIKALDSYLSLQTMRADSNFDYSIDFPFGDASSIYIYPMVIQPFVENAIQHGIKDVGYKGFISIKIRKESKYLICTVEDNGRGIENNPSLNQDNNYHRTSLAIQITKERLELLSGKAKNKFTIQFEDKNKEQNDRGTIVTIRIPYQSHEE